MCLKRLPNLMSLDLSGNFIKNLKIKTINDYLKNCLDSFECLLVKQKDPTFSKFVENKLEVRKFLEKTPKSLKNDFFDVKKAVSKSPIRKRCGMNYSMTFQKRIKTPTKAKDRTSVSQIFEMKLSKANGSGGRSRLEPNEVGSNVIKASSTQKSDGKL